MKNCNMCQGSKAVRHEPYGLLQPSELQDQPWWFISMDFITDIPESDRYDTILNLVDRLTKMSYCISYRKDLDTRQFTTLFMQHIERLDGIPRYILTDRGTLFPSGLWKQITQKLEIERKLSTAYHLQTEAQTDRTNVILEQYLQAYVNNQQDNWNYLLPLAQFVYNN